MGDTYDRLKLMPNFEVVHEASALDNSQKSDWGRELVGAQNFYTITKGAGIKVCVIDTGAPQNHPDLEGAIKGVFNAYGTDFPLDRCGHASHCAGIIGARDNSIGTIGIAPECDLYMAQGLDDSGFGDWGKITDCINWAVIQNVDIINMSLGDLNEPPAIVHNAIIQAADKGILIVCAAGNDQNADYNHPTSDDVTFPAKYDECIAVGALDKNGQLAYFSDRGNELDAIEPGVNIFSCYRDNGYAILSGTSQAAPIISGILALLKAHKPDSITNYKDAIRELQGMSIKQNEFFQITGNYSVGIPVFAAVLPEFANIKV